MSRIFTRRSLLTTAAMGLPAVAFGGTLLGGSSTARSAPKGASPGLTNKIGGPAGAAKIAGDYQPPESARPLAELVLKKARHAFTTASANPDAKFGKSKLASASSKFLGQLKTPRVGRAKGRASLLLSAGGTKATNAFGPYAKLKTKDYEASPARDPDIHAQFDLMKAKPPKVKNLKDKKIKKEKKVKREKKEEEKEEPKIVAPHYERLEFHLNSVKCIEDTNEFDSDEIKMGGQLIRPDGIVKKIDAFTVHDNFDPGKVRNYDSSACIGASSEVRRSLEELGVCHGHYSDPYRGKVLTATRLDGPWPGTYGLVMLMVEEDYGGFNNLLTELYAAIRDELDQAIAELGTTVAESIGHAIGQVVGQIVVWIVSELVEWIVSLFDNVDDPLQAKSWVIELPDADDDTIDEITAGGLDVPSGMRASKMKEMQFAGDGGKYLCRMHWRTTD